MRITPPDASIRPNREFEPSKQQRVFSATVRCHVCGSGSLYADDVGIITRRHEAPAGMAMDTPRRGRPLRRSVELRARKGAA